MPEDRIELAQSSSSSCSWAPSDGRCSRDVLASRCVSERKTDARAGGRGKPAVSDQPSPQPWIVLKRDGVGQMGFPSIQVFDELRNRHPCRANESTNCALLKWLVSMDGHRQEKSVTGSLHDVVGTANPSRCFAHEFMLENSQSPSNGSEHFHFNSWHQRH